ncbi:MAG TPA: glycosyltransferase family A protein [Edaphocola sp.]|nr:glycosyltransferase family A protein [Edaphocola sp.]
MKEHNPFFSIIVTAFNRGYLIQRALNSLLNQDEKDWECIIIDDGSTDDTTEIVKPFLESYPFIQYYKQENQGCPTAKNEGIRRSSGSYITFLDSDDEYGPQHLSFRKHLLMSQPEIDLLHGGMEIIGSPFVPDRFDLVKKIHLKDCVVGGTFFIKQQVFEKIGNFENIAMGHDAVFFENVEKAGLKVVKIDFPSYIYHKDNTDAMTYIADDE